MENKTRGMGKNNTSVISSSEVQNYPNDVPRPEKKTKTKNKNKKKTTYTDTGKGHNPCRAKFQTKQELSEQKKKEKQTTTKQQRRNRLTVSPPSFRPEQFESDG